MLKDKDIRDALIKSIKKKNNNHSFRIIEEMNVCDGVSRVDVAVANGHLCGYEIKSDADNLDRLKIQTASYNKTFDRITIVVGSKFTEKIFNYVPEFWGICAAKQDRDRVKLRYIRKAKYNTNVDPFSLLNLLWKDELLNILSPLKIKGISKMQKSDLIKLVVVNYSKTNIRNYTREIIKTRNFWREFY